VGRAELDGQLDRVGAELAYLLSEDATLRQRLGAAATAGLAGDEPRLAGDLAQLASPTLAYQVIPDGQPR
jgi:hypothetical protein